MVRKHMHRRLGLRLWGKERERALSVCEHSTEYTHLYVVHNGRAWPVGIWQEWCGWHHQVLLTAIYHQYSYLPLLIFTTTAIYH